MPLAVQFFHFYFSFTDYSKNYRVANYSTTFNIKRDFFPTTFDIKVRSELSLTYISHNKLEMQNTTVVKNSKYH